MKYLAILVIFVTTQYVTSDHYDVDDDELKTLLKNFKDGKNEEQKDITVCEQFLRFICINIDEIMYHLFYGYIVRRPTWTHGHYLNQYNWTHVPEPNVTEPMDD